MTRAFDRNRQSALVLRGSTGYTTRQNFTALADEFLERFNIFIVNVSDFVYGEVTNLAAFTFSAFTTGSEFAIATIVASVISLLESHYLVSPFYFSMFVPAAR